MPSKHNGVRVHAHTVRVRSKLCTLVCLRVAPLTAELNKGSDGRVAYGRCGAYAVAAPPISGSSSAGVGPSPNHSPARSPGSSPSPGRSPGSSPRLSPSRR